MKGGREIQASATNIIAYSGQKSSAGSDKANFLQKGTILR